MSVTATEVSSPDTSVVESGAVRVVVTLTSGTAIVVRTVIDVFVVSVFITIWDAAVVLAEAMRIHLHQNKSA
jgi:hypothetical protein